MHSTHALSPGSRAGTGVGSQAGSRADEQAMLDAVGSIVGHRVELSDRLEADLAIDSVDLARIAGLLPFDLYARLASLDVESLTALTVGGLVA